MTATNQWAIGEMFYGGLLNGLEFYTQPGGPGTQVFPTQQNAQPWPDYPIPGLFINEFVPWWTPGCGHSIKFWSIIRQFDNETNESVAIIACPICSYIENIYSPYEEVLEPITHSIIVA